ncbi:MAG: molybdopterin molybdotransferase MoeA [Nitrospirae bacterium]|nr:molybdopterin molybdotransferase MoeA [Nitrospirota bacterium]
MGKQGFLISVDEARRKVLDRALPLPPTAMALEDALGHVLAEEISATTDMPPFDASAMDGFALRSEDTKRAGAETPVSLSVQGVIRAGDASALALARSAAIRIMTGAVVPPLADAVVEKEAVEEHDGRILLRAPVPPANHIRRRGSDVPCGRRLLAPGHVLDAPSLFLAAASGRSRLTVGRRPRVSMIVTGDELVPFSETPGAAQIRDVNSPLIGAFLREMGIDPEPGSVVRDSADDLAVVLGRSIRQSEVVILSGGVSAGDYDVVREVLKRVGAQELFAGVSQKPGKPMTFAVADSKLIFGLPGNPIAVLVCLYEYVRPAVQRMMGFPEGNWFLQESPARITESITKKAGRTHFLRACVEQSENGLVAEILEGQESYQVSNLARANAWVVLDADLRAVTKGSLVRAHLLPGARLRSIAVEAGKLRGRDMGRLHPAGGEIA